MSPKVGAVLLFAPLAIWILLIVFTDKLSPPITDEETA